MSASHLNWDVARAAGLTTLILLTCSMALGLSLSMGVASPRWPRFLTNDLHRFLALTSLVFLGVHVASVAIDPFTHFRLADVLVPFASSYHTGALSVGIVAAYLMLAVWFTTLLQKRMGYRAWRLTHYATFAVYLLAIVHAVLIGTDRNTPWAKGVELGSLALVGGLTALRLDGAGGRTTPRPMLALALVAGLAFAAGMVIAGGIATPTL
jgi:methionine sulfoxide reductase heme-binding subunit